MECINHDPVQDCLSMSNLEYHFKMSRCLMISTHCMLHDLTNLYIPGAVSKHVEIDVPTCRATRLQPASGLALFVGGLGLLPVADTAWVPYFPAQDPVL